MGTQIGTDFGRFAQISFFINNGSANGQVLCIWCMAMITDFFELVNGKSGLPIMQRGRGTGIPFFTFVWTFSSEVNGRNSLPYMPRERG